MIFSVKNFGARGDGMTDDTAAICAAMRAASGGSKRPPPGRLIFFPKGSYRVFRPFVVEERCDPSDPHDCGTET